MSKVEVFLLRAGEILENYIRPMLRGECYMSLVIRTPGQPEQDIFVSEDPDLEEVIKLLERSRDRPITARAEKVEEPKP